MEASVIALPFRTLEYTGFGVVYQGKCQSVANERTFLAWIRTAIGIMAFGFVVEKFSLFLK
jgi:uncharacterized membrane protein YidH (DUF202 family)